MTKSIADVIRSLRNNFTIDPVTGVIKSIEDMPIQESEIMSEEQYEKALRRLEKLMDKEDSEKINKEINRLVNLIIEYEEKYYPFP